MQHLHKYGLQSVTICLCLLLRKVYHINQELYIFSKAIGLVLLMSPTDLFNQIDESKLKSGDDSQLWLFEEQLFNV